MFRVMCGEVITNAKTKKLSFKQYSFLQTYWQQNEDWLENYFSSYPSFCVVIGRIIRDYGLEVRCEIPGLRDIVQKTRARKQVEIIIK